MGISTLLLVLACDRPGIVSRDDHLPAWISVVAEFEDGRHGSVLVDLGDPRQAPAVSYAEEVLLYDGERLFMGSPDTPAQGNVLLTDLVSGELGSVQLGAPGAEDLVVAGPGQGFALVVADGVVELSLPYQDQPIALMRGVERLHCLRWVPGSKVEPAALQVAQVHFKAVRVVHALEDNARVDGVLDEWKREKALAIDTSAHVLAGEAAWSGPRDASFGVAARRHHERISVALRVRDDDLRPGEDKLEFELPVGTVQVPVAAGGPCKVPKAWECAFTDSVDFGTGLEISFPAPPEADARLPLVVRYTDIDADEEGSVLANAPTLRSLSVRVPRAEEIQPPQREAHAPEPESVPGDLHLPPGEEG